ncbi:hypothetical protein ACVWZZ_005787 [Bradyrhizobium sp. LM6.10]
MAKLKLAAIEKKPVKVTHELPDGIHRGLIACAEILARETGQPITDLARLIAPKLARFIAADRTFRKARRAPQRPSGGEG